MKVQANKVKRKESESISKLWVFLLLALAVSTYLISSERTYAQEVTFATIFPTADLCSITCNPTRAFLKFQFACADANLIELSCTLKQRGVNVPNTDFIPCSTDIDMTRFGFIGPYTEGTARAQCKFVPCVQSAPEDIVCFDKSAVRVNRKVNLVEVQQDEED